jgi:hypothetical protein
VASSTPVPDHYRTLGVPPTASAAEIRSAYRSAARRLHPDAGGSAEAMQRLNMAWTILRDPGRRAAYDRSRSGPGAGSGAGGNGGGPWVSGAGASPDATADWFDVEADADDFDPTPLREVRAPEGWWALAPPAMLIFAVGLLLGAFFFASPAMLVFSGAAFFIAAGLFVLAPLAAMTRQRR